MTTAAERPLRAIQIDPYFDGDRDAQGRLTLPPRDGGSPLTPPTQYGYRDAGEFHTANGIPLTGVMRPGPEGLRGTVIPRATLGGIPQGTRPHATRDIEVNIDPHIKGQSSRVRLGDLNEHSVAQAIRLAAEITPEPTSIETLRLRGAATMHAIAQAHPQPPATPPRPPAPQQPQYQEQPTYPQQPQYQQPQYPQQAPQQQYPQQYPQQPPPQPQPQPQRRVSPLSAFNQAAPQPQATRELRQIDLREAPAMAGPPTIGVIFEVEHFGSMEVRYHDVLIENGFIVLVFDTRHQGSTKYFPPVAQTESAPPMALNVVGTNEVYLVHTTGLQYVHEGREYCLLMVERTGSMTEG